jgi:hypothetical protein
MGKWGDRWGDGETDGEIDGGWGVGGEVVGRWRELTYFQYYHIQVNISTADEITDEVIQNKLKAAAGTYPILLSPTLPLRTHALTLSQCHTLTLYHTSRCALWSG